MIEALKEYFSPEELADISESVVIGWDEFFGKEDETEKLSKACKNGELKLKPVKRSPRYKMSPELRTALDEEAKQGSLIMSQVDSIMTGDELTCDCLTNLWNQMVDGASGNNFFPNLTEAVRAEIADVENSFVDKEKKLQRQTKTKARTKTKASPFTANIIAHAKYLAAKREKQLMAEKEDQSTWSKSKAETEEMANARKKVQTDEDSDFIPYYSMEDAGEWIASHSGTIRCIVKKYVDRVRNSSYTEEDLIQEACIAICKSIKNFNPARCGQSAASFFQTVMENKMREICRSLEAEVRTTKNTEYVGLMTTDNKWIAPLQIGEDNAEKDVILRDLFERAEAALRYQGETRLTIFYLYVMGYTQVEIAEMIYRSQASVSFHLNAMRKILKEVL